MTNFVDSRNTLKQWTASIRRVEFFLFARLGNELECSRTRTIFPFVKLNFIKFSYAQDPFSTLYF